MFWSCRFWDVVHLQWTRPWLVILKLLDILLRCNSSSKFACLIETWFSSALGENYFLLSRYLIGILFPLIFLEKMPWREIVNLILVDHNEHIYQEKFCFKMSSIRYLNWFQVNLSKFLGVRVKVTYALQYKDGELSRSDLS